MSGVNTINFLYPEDTTGQASTNRVVNEFHTLTSPNDPLSYHFIIPSAAPFFLDSVKLFDVQTGRELIKGIDWTPGQRFDTASYELNNVRGGVYGAIMFFDLTLTGMVELREYQTLGGSWTLSADKLLEILSNREQDPRTLTYEEVSGKPSVFPPVEHNHDANDDLIGMTELVSATLSVATAIREKADGGLGGIDDYTDDEIDSFLDVLRSDIDQLRQGKLDKDGVAKNSERVFGLSKTQLIQTIGQEIDVSSDSIVEIEVDTECEFGVTYFIKAPCTAILPSDQNAEENLSLTFHKAVGINVIVVSNPVGSEPIVLGGVEDTSMLYDVNRPLTLIYDHIQKVWVI